MIYHPVSSSNIASIGYDSSTATLGVRFHNGGTYHYFDVTPSDHDDFMNASSKGTFLHERIKGRYRYARV